ncbi:thiol reductant ABC exporter subunit CydC [Mycobacterium sp.]|uniref:thiol reductant ABC exporter subunit CydC n=1 Tax=Mycobacterium sp. TaxID=1785 RepID=UPI003C77170D
MLASDPLPAAVRLLQPRIARLLLAIALGVLSLSSALALAGLSAWLITRAWQMPPVLDLSIAVVAVRTFAISRGLLHYCERLASHDTALRAAGRARALLYTRLAHGPADVATRLHSGELVARVGADVDQLADVLVRTVLPFSVAAVLAVAAIVVVGVISAPAGAILAVCLFVAGVAAPALSSRAARAQEVVARQHHSARDVTAMLALEHAPELRVGGMLRDVISESQRRQRDWGDAVDAAARPAAFAEALPTAAIGVSVLGAVVAGIGVAGSVAPTTLAILMLLPLSAFEATTALPAAAIQLTRSRLAARRLLDFGTAGPTLPSVDAGPSSASAAALPSLKGRLRTDNMVAACRGGRPPAALTIDLPPGARLAVTGPSGSGKTTLLMTLADLLVPSHGDATLDGVPLGQIAEREIRGAIGFFAEDAHIFATTIRDNLLVARGDCSDQQLSCALRQVGLDAWLAGLPDGLGTMLAGGAAALSAGQRRRLLLARALISPVRIVLLDEPTEHLDAADAEPILRSLLTSSGGLIAAERTVVVATHHLPDDIRCLELRVGPAEYSGEQSSMTPDRESEP